jgi:hypothetical protein
MIKPRIRIIERENGDVKKQEQAVSDQIHKLEKMDCLIKDIKVGFNGEIIIIYEL